MVGTWPKPATSKLSLLVRSVKGTGSAAARAAAAGEAGEPSDGGRACSGASAAVAGGAAASIAAGRCAGRRLWTDRSWRADFGWDVLRLNQERRRRHERLIRVDAQIENPTGGF